MADDANSKKRFLSLVRVAIAIGILGWIGSTLPWDDQLTWHQGEGVVRVAGEIDGDWKQDRIEFRFADAELPADWPQRARQAASTGNALAIDRRVGEGDGFDWQPSMTRAFRAMERSWVGMAMALFVVASILASTRWWRLLAVCGCATSWFNAVRLTYVGFTFNLVMPGLTGGDLVKGVIAAKENPKRRADAVVSVVVDRVIGLGALAVLAIAVILIFAGEAFAALKLPLIGLLVAGLVGAGLYAYRPLRKTLGLSRLVDRLPLGDKLRSLDNAALLYLEHPGELVVAFLLSIGNHLVVCTGVYFLALAIGVDTTKAGWKEFVVLASVANMVSAIPIAPGGWGVGEFIYKYLFAMVGLSEALGVAVSVIFRLCTLFGLGLIGGLFLLLPGMRAEVRDVDPTDPAA